MDFGRKSSTQEAQALLRVGATPHVCMVMSAFGTSPLEPRSRYARMAQYIGIIVPGRAEGD